MNYLKYAFHWVVVHCCIAYLFGCAAATFDGWAGFGFALLGGVVIGSAVHRVASRGLLNE